MRDTDEASYGSVLDKLLNFQQTQLTAGFPTFVLVTSLDLHIIHNQLVTGSGRPYATIPLPPLTAPDVDAALKSVDLEQNLRVHCGGDSRLLKRLQRSFTAHVGMAGGHPGAIYKVLRPLFDDNSPAPGAPCPPVNARDAGTALKL